jgi:hypothetical protein
MSLGEFNGFLFHPGGAKVLKTVQSLLELRRDDLGYSWAVLRDFGNMSSPTALFTLDQALNAGASGPHLMAALRARILGLFSRRGALSAAWPSSISSAPRRLRLLPTLGVASTSLRSAWRRSATD